MAEPMEIDTPSEDVISKKDATGYINRIYSDINPLTDEERVSLIKYLIKHGSLELKTDSYTNVYDNYIKFAEVVTSVDFNESFRTIMKEYKKQTRLPCNANQKDVNTYKKRNDFHVFTNIFAHKRISDDVYTHLYNAVVCRKRGPIPELETLIDESTINGKIVNCFGDEVTKPQSTLFYEVICMEYIKDHDEVEEASDLFISLSYALNEKYKEPDNTVDENYAVPDGLLNVFTQNHPLSTGKENIIRAYCSRHIFPTLKIRECAAVLEYFTNNQKEIKTRHSNVFSVNQQKLIKVWNDFHEVFNSFKTYAEWVKMLTLNTDKVHADIGTWTHALFLTDYDKLDGKLKKKFKQAVLNGKVDGLLSQYYEKTGQEFSLIRPEKDEEVEIHEFEELDIPITEEYIPSYDDVKQVDTTGKYTEDYKYVSAGKLCINTILLRNGPVSQTKL